MYADDKSYPLKSASYPDVLIFCCNYSVNLVSNANQGLKNKSNESSGKSTKEMQD